MRTMAMKAWIDPPAEDPWFLVDLDVAGAAGGNILAPLDDTEPMPELVGVGVGVDVRPPAPLY